MKKLSKGLFAVILAIGLMVPVSGIQFAFGGPDDPLSLETTDVAAVNDVDTDPATETPDVEDADDIDEETVETVDAEKTVTADVDEADDAVKAATQVDDVAKVYASNIANREVAKLDLDEPSKTAEAEEMIFTKVTTIDQLNSNNYFVITNVEGTYALSATGGLTVPSTGLNVTSNGNQLTMTGNDLEDSGVLFNFVYNSSDTTSVNLSKIWTTYQSQTYNLYLSQTEILRSAGASTNRDITATLQSNTSTWKLLADGYRGLTFSGASFGTSNSNGAPGSDLTIWVESKKIETTTYYRYNGISGLDELNDPDADPPITGNNFIITIPDMETGTPDSFVINNSSTWFAPVNSETAPTSAFYANNGQTLQVDESTAGTSAYLSVTSYTESEGDYKTNDPGSYYKYGSLYNGNGNWYPQYLPSRNPFRTSSFNNTSVRFEYMTDSNGAIQIYLRGNGNNSWLGYYDGQFVACGPDGSYTPTEGTTVKATLVPIRIYINGQGASITDPIDVNFYDGAPGTNYGSTPIATFNTSSYFPLVTPETTEYNYNGYKYVFIGWTFDLDLVPGTSKKSNQVAALSIDNSTNLYGTNAIEEGTDSNSQGSNGTGSESIDNSDDETGSTGAVGMSTVTPLADDPDNNNGDDDTNDNDGNDSNDEPIKKPSTVPGDSNYLEKGLAYGLIGGYGNAGETLSMLLDLADKDSEFYGDLASYINEEKELNLYSVYAVMGFNGVVTADVADTPIVGISDWKALQPDDGYYDLQKEIWLGSAFVNVYLDGGEKPIAASEPLYFSYHNDDTVDVDLKFIWDDLVSQESTEAPVSGGVPMVIADGQTQLYNYMTNGVYPDFAQIGCYVIDDVFATQGSSETGIQYALNWLTESGGQLDNVIGGTTIDVYVTSIYNAEYFLDDELLTGDDWVDPTMYSTLGTDEAFSAAVEQAKEDNTESDATVYEVDDSNKYSALMNPEDNEGSFEPESIRGGYGEFAYNINNHYNKFTTGPSPADLVADGYSLTSEEWELIAEDGESMDVPFDSLFEITGSTYGTGNTYFAYMNEVPNVAADEPMPYTYHFYAYSDTPENGGPGGYRPHPKPNTPPTTSPITGLAVTGDSAPWMLMSGIAALAAAGIVTSIVMKRRNAEKVASRR